MSQFIVQTAGKQVLGRGGLTHYLHATEFAFWDNAKEQLGGAAQEVPDSPDTIIIIESTANGVGGAFYDMYMQAMEDWRSSGDLHNYIPIFLPWYIFPEYQMAVKGGFEVGKSLIPGYEDEWLLPEHELVEVNKCTPEQLMWRRWAIKNRCQGDLSLFKQEFPGNVQEAFQSSGRPVFSQTMLNRQESVLPRNYRYGLFSGDDFQSVNQSFNCWKMISPSVSSHEYTIGIDTMEGRVSDPSDEKSKQDRHGVAVYDRVNNQFVCIFHGNIDQHELGEQCLLAAKYYNDAYIAPEIPNGMEVLGVFKRSGYENIYNRQTHDEQYESDESDNLGWRTTVATRPMLVESFKTLIATTSVGLSFSELIDEMRTFVYDKTGKPVHAAGKHDDLLFAAMIAVQVHLRCPMNVIPYQYSNTYEPARIQKLDSNLSQIGAVDTGITDEEQEDEWLQTE